MLDQLLKSPVRSHSLLERGTQCRLKSNTHWQQSVLSQEARNTYIHVTFFNAKYESVIMPDKLRLCVLGLSVDQQCFTAWNFCCVFGEHLIRYEWVLLSEEEAFCPVKRVWPEIREKEAANELFWREAILIRSSICSNVHCSPRSIKENEWKLLTTFWKMYESKLRSKQSPISILSCNGNVTQEEGE